MESSISRQLWEAASGLLAGGGLGLLFELLCPFVSSRRRSLSLISQTLYLMVSFVWVFLAGQLGGRGATPLYLLICAAGWLSVCGTAASVRRALGEYNSSKHNGKVMKSPDMRVLPDKIEKKHRIFFSKRTMQNSKNHI